jgi:GTP cyclohydrolase I
LRIRDEVGELVRVPATADAFVSLDDPHVKGIHMSRLFLAVQEGLAREEFSFALLERLLHAFVESQSGISRSAELRLNFEYFARRRSLRTDHTAWRTYPITAVGSIAEGKLTLSLGVRITYSSTCPCSAALARQLIQERFKQEFRNERHVDAAEVYQWLGTEEAVCATPHSQRSYADVVVILKSANDAPALLPFIDLLEDAVGTPVQATVKREDEQEFARLNGANLMFAEDAARRLRSTLEGFAAASDYRIYVRHLESLHPHDAVSVAVKGIPGGLAP